MNQEPKDEPRSGSLDALLGLSALAMLPEPPPVNRETSGPGICDLCGEEAPHLKVFNMQPASGICYCRKCAPGRETDDDWPNAQDEGSAPSTNAATKKDEN